MSVENHFTPLTNDDFFSKILEGQPKITTFLQLCFSFLSCILTNSNIFQLNEDRNILEEAQGYEPKGTFFPLVTKVCVQYPTFSVDI